MVFDHSSHAGGDMSVPDAMVEMLQQRFVDFWVSIGGQDHVGTYLFSIIQREYSDSRRHYHTLKHIASCLAVFDATGIAGQPEVECAIWFHDLVYVPMAQDNEVRSAAMCQKQIEGTRLSKEQKEKIGRMIIATKEHKVAPDLSFKLLLDTDMSILGAHASEYDEYARNIKKEYTQFGLTMQKYAEGRHAFLSAQITKALDGRLFFLQHFNHRLLEQALANMRRERVSLIPYLE